MALRRNVIANYVSQAYVALVGIVMVPVYIRYMGAEAYGLVGFFAMLQGLFQLLDIGLTPTVAREAARLNGGASTAGEFRRLFKLLLIVFGAVAVLGTGALVGAADYVATRWLKAQTLPAPAVHEAVVLIAFAVGLRWMSGLFRAVLSGLEHQVLLSQVNSAIATARFVLIVPIFWWVGTQPLHFFTYQIVVAVAELVVLSWLAHRHMPQPLAREGGRSGMQSLRDTLRFSLSVAFTGAVWVLVTQLDKLVLSRVLPLAEYGYFTVAVLVAGAVNTVSGPLSAALTPRLTRLHAMKDEAGLERLYRTATRYVAALAAAVSLVLAVMAHPILLGWTGDAELAASAAPVLALYALGNGVLAVGAFPYYLQFARGNLRLHLLGNVLYVSVLVPVVAWAASLWGGLGAGWVWLGMNVGYFLLWSPLVHRRWMRLPHLHWLGRDVALPIAAACLGAGLAAAAMPSLPSRLMIAVAAFGALVVTAIPTALTVIPLHRFMARVSHVFRPAQ